METLLEPKENKERSYLTPATMLEPWRERRGEENGVLEFIMRKRVRDTQLRP
jgi:hypothetical protein